MREILVSFLILGFTSFAYADTEQPAVIIHNETDDVEEGLKNLRIFPDAALIENVDTGDFTILVSAGNTGENTLLDTSFFNNNLSSLDDTVQKMADTLVAF